MSETPATGDEGTGRRRLRHTFSLLGPGLLVAATGVGAGDLISASVAGSRFGFTVAWAALLGAAIKFVLNEGLARWQLSTGTSLLEGWLTHLGRWVGWLFGAYLLLWSFVVAGALAAACGLAAHALAPQLSVAWWGAIHSVVAAAFVFIGRYASFERIVGIFVGVMFVSLILAAVVAAPPGESLWRVFSEAAIPDGSVALLLGVIGGVGGSVTLLSYGYWMREKGWRGIEMLRRVRIDLAVAYGLTGLFGLAIVVLAARVLYPDTQVAGSQGALTMARMLGDVAGPIGRYAFLVGFWGAVATSMLGVWNGVPYLFTDFMRLMRRSDEAGPATGSRWYRGFLLFLAGPPLILLQFDKPVALVVVYTVLGALFMPFVAATLLYLNGSERRVGTGRSNGPVTILVLLTALALFGYLAWTQLSRL